MLTQAMLEAILKTKIDKLELDKSTDLLNENAGDKNGRTTWRIQENEATHLVMTDYFEIIIIEIPKVVKEYKKTPNDEVLQWMLFLDNPEKKNEKILNIK